MQGLVAIALLTAMQMIAMQYLAGSIALCVWTRQQSYLNSCIRHQLHPKAFLLSVSDPNFLIVINFSTTASSFIRGTGSLASVFSFRINFGCLAFGISEVILQIGDMKKMQGDFFTRAGSDRRRGSGFKLKVRNLV